MEKKKRSVVLGVTGSIAAYKSAELASLLVKQGHEVQVVMTKDATEFITPLTLQTLSKNPVTTSFYDEKQSWHPGHIALADHANLLLIAPATAHIIAELAQGLAGHPLAAIALATTIVCSRDASSSCGVPTTVAPWSADSNADTASFHCALNRAFFAASPPAALVAARSTTPCSASGLSLNAC